jgi:hypothetical protein
MTGTVLKTPWLSGINPDGLCKSFRDEVKDASG